MTYADLNIGSYDKKENTQFTTDEIPVRNIELGDFQYESGKKYFALVILNANDTREEDDRYKTESVDYTPFVYPKVGENEKFKTWATTAQSCSMTIQKENISTPIPKNFAAHYPTMTNATGMTGSVSGKYFRPVTLVQISNDDLTTTKVDNSYDSKTLIYLHRNVARVILQPKIKDGGNDIFFDDKKVTITDPDSKDEWTAKVNISNWCLDLLIMNPIL